MKIILYILLVLQFYIIKSEENKYLINDYCNIGQSFITVSFFEEIENYFKITSSENNSNKCLILDNILQKYIEPYLNISKYNKDSFIYYKCTNCQKNFSTINLLNLHYKLFHSQYNKSYICPGDLCAFIECKKYYKHFNIKKNEINPQAVKFNRQPLERNDVCQNELILYYKEVCMKLIKNCFNNDKNKIYEYYKYICNQISCNNEYDEDFIEDGNGFIEILKYIFIYILGILSFIYIIIIWLSKYT